MPVSNLTNAWNAARVWLRKLAGRGPKQDLTGRPLHPRVKTYSASTGQVFQHVYRGQKESADAIEFVFSVSNQARQWRSLNVVLRWQVLNSWQGQHGLVLTGAQRYAIAKMAMFHWFDENSAESTQAIVVPNTGEMHEYLEALHII